MKIKKVTAAFFSPTGNVQKVSECIGRAAAEMLQAEYMEFDFLRPENRYDIIRFGPDELLVVGVPVYAGRVPNKILPFIQSGFRSAAGTFCIPFVCFGNRSFDDGLSELTMEMRNSGFAVVGAAAVASEHSFCESQDVRTNRTCVLSGDSLNVSAKRSCRPKQQPAVQLRIMEAQSLYLMKMTFRETLRPDLTTPQDEQMGSRRFSLRQNRRQTKKNVINVWNVRTGVRWAASARMTRHRSQASA